MVELPTVIFYEVFPTDKNEGLIEIVEAESIQGILDEGMTIKDKLSVSKSCFINYFKSLGINTIVDF